MLNLHGAFVVVFTNRVEPHVLGGNDLRAYYERIAIVGPLKTDQFTFGGEALFALPCKADLMQGIALNYPMSEPMALEVRAMCATIALGKPVGHGNTVDPTEGGLGIKAAHTRPKAPKGSGGARVAVPTSSVGA